MPLYTYLCQDCDKEFEALVFDGDEVSCPHCQGRQLERQWGLPARPQAQTTSLPMGCDPGLPPCGPGCCRIKPS
jgi:putative FmdB family regulatory protein